MEQEVKALVKVTPAAVQEQLLTRGAKVWMDSLLEELKPGPYCAHCKRPRRARWAFILFAKTAKLVGADPQVLILLLQRFGVTDMQGLEALIESGKRFEQLKADASTSIDDYIDRATELLVLSLQERPSRRAAVLDKLVDSNAI